MKKRLIITLSQYRQKNKKLLLMMKLMAIIMTITVFQTVGSVYSQNTTFNFHLKNVPVKSVLQEIENTSEFKFLYRTEYLDVNRKVDVKADNDHVETILENIFNSPDITYRIFEDNLIVITNNRMMQQRIITGKVTDASTGEPVPGANVVIEGTIRGTITSLTGEYSLEVPGPDVVLVFSYIGYISRKVTVGDRSVVDITLEVDMKALEEVVVVGYGTLKRQEITGSVGSVREEDFNKGIIISPEQLLQGKVSGVNVTSSSGEPGAAQSITIRGPGSVRSGNAPLFVVDGVPLDNSFTSPSLGGLGIGTSGPPNPLNFLNPSDIESIDVLKDASATAIYGSRGANGVVIITTKGGTTGDKFNYSGSYSLSNVSKRLDVLSRDEFVKFTNERGNPAYVLSGDTDWQDQIFRTAYTQNHNLSFSGSSQNTGYFASLSVLDQEGVVKKSEMKRYTGRINASQKLLNDRLNVKINLTASYTRNDSPPSGDGGRAEGELFSNMLNGNPTFPTHNADGSIFHFPNGYNPLFLLETFTDFTKANRVLGNLETGLRIIKGLEYKFNFAIDNSMNSRIGVVNPHPIANLDFQTGRLEDATSQSSSQLVDNYLSYLLSESDHNVNFLLGHSYQQFNYETRRWSINNFATTEIDPYYNPGIGNSLDLSQNRPAGSAWRNELQSFFSRINYNYQSKYMVTATGRFDGSSKFGKNNRYAFFPSFAGAWRLSSEEFLADVNAVSNLMLRVGWGMTGNQEIPPKITKPQLTVGSGDKAGYPLDGGTIIYPGFNFVRIPNEDIKWEVSRQTNVGIDFSFLDSKLYGTVDVFSKVSTDILWRSTQTIDPINPTSEFWNNYDMEIQNKGLEVALGYRKFDIARGLNLDMGGNVTFIKNNIEGLPVSILSTGVLSGPGLTGVTVNGYLNNQPVGTFYLLDWIGFDSNGFNVFRDVNNDGAITADDRIAAGSALPKVQYNLYLSLAYKNFDLSINFNGVSGNKIYNNTENAFLNYPILMAGNNVTRNVLESTAENPINSATPSTRFLHDGSFLRLNNATIGYKPKSKILLLNNLRFYITGQNLITITGYEGFDPEVNTPKYSDDFLSYGIDYISYPKARTFLFGLSLTF